MKILFDHHDPFHFAHGGLQIQIEQTKIALENIGVEVEWLRWWDADQRGKVIHFFGRPSDVYIQQAHAKGERVVFLELLTGLGSRSALERRMQRAMVHCARRFMPRGLIGRMCWDSYRLADACIANTEFEASLMRQMFDAPVERVQVVPNGVEDAFFEAAPVARGPWLVCTATIVERKRILELARAAAAARTPVWVIGIPYAESDAYFREFTELVRQHPEHLRYEGGINDRGKLAAIYREARGFVLLSQRETRSLSSEEAAATGCPLLLSDLPWARSVFGDSASYCAVTPDTAVTAQALAAFYTAAPQRPPPIQPLSWTGVAQRFLAIYERVIQETVPR